MAGACVWSGQISPFQGQAGADSCMHGLAEAEGGDDDDDADADQGDNEDEGRQDAVVSDSAVIALATGPSRYGPLDRGCLNFSMPCEDVLWYSAAACDSPQVFGPW